MARCPRTAPCSTARASKGRPTSPWWATRARWASSSAVSPRRARPTSWRRRLPCRATATPSSARGRCSRSWRAPASAEPSHGPPAQGRGDRPRRHPLPRPDAGARLLHARARPRRGAAARGDRAHPAPRGRRHGRSRAGRPAAQPRGAERGPRLPRRRRARHGRAGPLPPGRGRGGARRPGRALRRARHGAVGLRARSGRQHHRAEAAAGGVMPRFGTSLPGVQQIPARAQAWERAIGGAQVLEAARMAERAGFDWVSCSDHVAVPVSRAAAMGATWFDAGSTLAFVAGATTRIRLLSHVLVLPYRHPLVIAKQYGTLDHLSGGRLILGVGSGHLKPEFRSVGADFERRGAQSDEYVQAIAAAWEQEVAGFDGQTVAFRDVMVAPRVAQRPRPPIWVGGNSQAAVRRAARHADGWIPWQLTPDDFAAAAADARRLRAEAGRPEAFEVVAPLAVPAGVTAEALVAAVARWRAAGATAFHTGIAACDLADLLARLEWFGREVIPRVA